MPLRVALLLAVTWSCASCEELLALDSFSLGTSSVDESAASPTCERDADCKPDAAEALMCSRETASCVPVLGEHCVEVVGPLDDPSALRIGALLTLRGPDTARNRERARSAKLAVEEINASGGLMLRAGSAAHPVTLVICDAGDDPLLAGRHLVNDLAVAAIVGPSSSDDVLTVTTQLSVVKRVLTVSPTATADSLGDLADDDLSWLLLPTDEQRAPLIVQQVQTLEAGLAPQRTAPLQLSVVYRNDAFGRGTRLSLSGLTLNGEAVFHPSHVGPHARVDVYDPLSTDLREIVDAQLDYQPDIIVLAGGMEAVTDFMGPLEERLHEDTTRSRAFRPHYVLTDAAKLPALLALAERVPDLAERVQGVGVTPSRPEAANAFRERYRARYDIANPDVAALAAAYDAVYAIVYAWAAAGGDSDGGAMAAGMRALQGGERAIAVGPEDLSSGLAWLGEHHAVYAQGVLAPLQWDQRGLPAAGVVEVWCLSQGEKGASFVGSGRVLDLASQELRGDPRACALPPAFDPHVVGGHDEAHVAAPGVAAPTTAPAAAHDGASSEHAAELPGEGDELDLDAGLPEPDRPELFVESRGSHVGQSDNTIDPGLRLGNRGTGPGVALETVKVRYYITSETSPLCINGCVTGAYWAGLMPIGEELTVSVTYKPSGWLTGYLEISFAQESPWLRPGQYAELTPFFHLSDYAELDEANDYSFEPAHADFAETRTVAVFRDDVLVWGKPPLL